MQPNPIRIIKDKKELVDQLELPSTYYSETMPETVQTQINKAKAKERTDIPTYLWSRNKYAESDVLEKIVGMYNRDDIPREDSSQLSVERFREQYEKCGQPVVIRGIVDEWRQKYSWSWAVS